jgi:hypothetical protein
MNLNEWTVRSWLNLLKRTESTPRVLTQSVAPKDAKLNAPEDLEIRFSKGANEESFLSGLTEKVRRFTGEEPKLVDVSMDHDPGTYEIWFSKR